MVSTVAIPMRGCVLRGQRLEVGGFTQQFSPAPNPADIHVDEVQGTIVADPTAMQF